MIGSASQASAGTRNLQVVDDFHTRAVARRGERPDDGHAFGPFGEMDKVQFERAFIRPIIGLPRDRDARADRGHLHDIPPLARAEQADVAIVRQQLRPASEIADDGEDRFARCANEDGVARVQGRGG